MLSKIAAAVAACVLLAHCAAPEGRAESVQSMSEIEGQWDIVSFDGHESPRLDSDGGRHAFVDISGGGLSFAIECNYSGIQARIENGRVIRLPGDDLQTEMGCGPEREARDRAFFAFLRNGPEVARRGADELVLTQDGVTLALQRAEVRQREFIPAALSELNGEWTTAIVYLQVEPGNTRNLLAFGDPGTATFNFAGGAAGMAFDCETIETAMRMTTPGTLQATAPQRARAGRCMLPEEDRDAAAALISGTVSAERIAPNMMHLVAGDVRAVLTRR